MGDSGEALAGLSKIFLNPEGYDCLPVRHNYTESGEYVYTGLFIPAFISVMPLMDKRGWCDPEKGKEHYNKEKEKITDAESLMMYSAEFCFTPEEALALEGQNEFNKEGLSEQKTRIAIHKQGKPILRGHLDFQFLKGQKPSFETILNTYFKPSNTGQVYITEEPYKDETGKIPDNLYVAGIDSIDLGMNDTSEATRDPSKFCIVIYKRAFGLNPPEVVAYYMDRPKEIKQAYMTALKMLMYYNCKALVEATKVGVINFFRERKIAKRFLMTRPRSTTTDVKGRIKNTYGVPATLTIIKHQLELISQLTYEFPESFWFPELIDQLLKYNFSTKTKFDMVAALGMVMLADEELSNFSSIKTSEKKTEWVDIGWYIDPVTGKKVRGLLTDNKIAHTQRSFNYGFTETDPFFRTTDPRDVI